MKEMTKPSAQYSTFEDLLDKDGVFVYTNVGISMMPLLRQRKDVIEIRRKEGRCGKYDVVLYKRGRKYVLHRILKVLPEGYLIAGDNCTIVEKDVTDDMILGVMTKIQRNGKMITPENRWYRMYVHLWCDVYPIRMMLLKIESKAWRIWNAAKRRTKRVIGKEPSRRAE